MSMELSLEEENRQLRDQLASVLGSSSWRLTRPLRRLRGMRGLPGSGRPETVPPPVLRPPVAEQESVVADAPKSATPDLDVPLFVPPGHFYSPLVDPREVLEEPRRSQLWPVTPRAMPAVDWRADAQVALAHDVFAQQERFAFRDDESPDPTEYFSLNDQYPPLDAWALEGMLRWLRPSRMIEIGSGWSSLVTARVNREQLDGQMRFTCIEPYPRQFIVDGVEGISDLIQLKIQDVPLDTFESLGERDVLFVDTSHIVKTGGDTTWIFQEILPRLAPGVVVHVHDIFLPFEYPVEWIQQGRSWNENHLVQAFLSFNDAYEILFGSMYMANLETDAVVAAFPGWSTCVSRGGGSLWLRRQT